jgi:HD-like signal output (HDOD) protein
MAAINDPEAAADRISAIIQQDPGLAANTLRVANSAAYGREIPIGDLTQAIIVLGEREIYRIAAAAMVSRWEESHQESLPWAPGAFARHSYAVAVTAEVLAGMIDGGDTASAYTAGLVGNIGRLTLAFICAPWYPSIGGYVRNRGMSWEDAETEILGYHHRGLGLLLMQSWNFPHEFISVAEFISLPEGAPVEHRLFIAQMHAARYLANSIDPLGTPDEFIFVPDMGFLNEYGFTAPILEEAVKNVRDRTRGHFGHPVSR